MGFEEWVHRFTDSAERRRLDGDPAWSAARPLDRALIRSLQRFQAGEDGDGASLIRKSDLAGDPHYSAAIRLFVAEEQNHARLLKQLLLGARVPPPSTVTGAIGCSWRCGARWGCDSN